VKIAVQSQPASGPPAAVGDGPSGYVGLDVAGGRVPAQATETDRGQRNIHFRLDRPRGARRVRVARDLLIDIDECSHLSGLWLLSVPPCPGNT
jgi:hypothetical protein